jgi:predicted dehydrogenase
MVGHVLEYHPAIAAMRARLRAGAIGSPLRIESTRVQPRGARRCDALWELAVHDVGVVLGTVSASVSSLSAVTPRACDGEHVDLRMLLDSGMRVRVTASADANERSRRTRIVGTRGALVLDEIEGTLEEQVGGAVRRIAFDSAEPLARECGAFVDAVVTRELPPTDVEMALEVVRVLDAAERSIARAGATIALAADASLLASAS